MNKGFSAPAFCKILVPVTQDGDPEQALAAALAISGSDCLLLVGFVRVEDPDSLSTAAIPAQEMRRRLKFLAERLGVQVRTRVHASHRLWDELTQAVRDEDPALLLLEWPRHFEALGMSLHEALSQAPCDIAIVRGPIPWKISSLLVPMRGGPYAELALRLSLEIYRRQATALTARCTSPRKKCHPNKMLPSAGWRSSWITCPRSPGWR